MPSTCRRFCFKAVHRGLIVAALLALTCGGSVLLGQPGSDESALSILRVYVPADRVAKELDKVQQGALVLLPLSEFETRVEQARKKVQARTQNPRLVRAHYSAELIDGCLRNGSGRWTVFHAGEAAAILSVSPMNVALRQLRWEQGGDAILGELVGKTLGLAIKPGGNQTCLFDWSANGAPTSEGIVFKLDVPPCPINTFDLKVPANQWLTALKDSGIATGPHDADSPGKRLWKIQVTGAQPIEILVRRIADPQSPAPTIFAASQCEQRLGVERCEIEHDFQLDILHGSVRQLLLEGDAGLHPYDVALKSGEVKTWKWSEIEPPKDAKGKPVAPAKGQLTIEFHRPVQGKLQGLQVRSLAARPDAGSWISAALRVAKAISRGETLIVKLPAALTLGKWDHGTFVPLKITTESDGSQILTLAETAADSTTSRRPALIAPSKGLDVQTTEDYQWQITPRGAALSAEIQYAPARGQLLGLRVKLPTVFPAYQIESVELQPPELLRDWQLEGPFLAVDLTQPLLPMKKAILKIRMNAGFRDLTTGIRELNYPELEPMAVARRRGVATIHLDPIFQAQLLSASVPLAPAPVGPQAKEFTRPSFRFAFREQRLSARIRLVPQPVQVRLRGNHALTLGEESARLQFRWEVDPLFGTPEHLDFRFAPGFPASWRIRDEDGLHIRHWERLPLHEAIPHLLLLGCQNEWQSSALHAFLPKGSYWRFHLAEPLRKNSRFTLEATLPIGQTLADWRRVGLQLAGGSPWQNLASAHAAENLPRTRTDRIWSLPLMTPVQRENMDGQMVVDSLLEPIASVAADGSLRPGTTEALAENEPIRVSMHSGAGAIDPGSRILVRTRSEKRTLAQRQLCDDARLTTLVHKDGRTYHRIRFRLWHWPDQTCELGLPPGCRVLGVKWDERWLEKMDTHATSTHLHLTLPFDQNAEFARYEVLVGAEAGRSFFPGLIQIKTPHIDWPIAPVDLQTRWQLEDGLAPLHQERLAPIGVPARIAGKTETAELLRHTWQWGRAWLTFGSHLEANKKLDEQKQTVHLAEKRLRDEVKKPLRLGEALERLAHQYLKGDVPLTIDRVAVRSLGLSAQTALAPAAQASQAERPFWESLGLVYVPCPSGALLTSPGRLQSLGIRGSGQTADLEDALQEAIAHGRDSSASFCMILNWLRSAHDEVRDSADDLAAPGASSLEGRTEWTEWEPVSDAAHGGTVLVLERSVARFVGWLLALLMALSLWTLERGFTPRTCFRVYVFILVVGILTATWLPIQAREYFAWPAILVMAAGFVWQLIQFVHGRSESAPHENSTIAHITGGAAALGACWLGCTGDLPAQVPAMRAHTVLIIDCAKPAALVTPALLAQLDELANRPDLGTQGVVLVAAKYSGKVQDSQATIDAHYELHSFKDKTNLIIPLTGVQLQEGVFLDGAPVFPVPHKQGYALPIRDKGAHQLRLSFSVRATVVNGQHELTFKIPRLVQNELGLQWQSPVQAIQGATCLGEEKQLPAGPKKRSVWFGQLGYVDTVQVRWASTTAAPAAKAIDVKEAHFWDLRFPAAKLFCSYQYTIGKESAAQLSVAMPEGLHVRSVEALMASAPAAPAQPILLKQWSIVGNGPQRRLTVDFAHPVTGKITLNLEVVPPASAQNPHLRLPLPAPLQGKSSAGLLGYHLDAPETRRAAQSLVAVQSMSVEEFEVQWKKQNGPPIPGATRALSFQRSAQQAGLELEIEPISRQTQAQYQWSVDHHFADLRGTFTLTSVQEDLTLLEFHIAPAFKLADVTGADVQRWHLQDALLQVWLRQNCKKTTIELTGWQVPPGKSAVTPSFTWIPASVVPLKTRLVDSTLDIFAASDLHMSAEKLKGLRSGPADNLRFAIEGAPFEATLRVKSRPQTPQASMLTKVQAREGRIEVWYGIRLPTERGRLATVKLHVKDWHAEPMVLEAPGAKIQSLPVKTDKESAWTLKYEPGLPEEVILTLRGEMALASPTPQALPIVQVDGVAISEHRMVWKDIELRDASTGIVLEAPVSDKKKLVSSVGAHWHADFAGWNVADAPPGSIKWSRPASSARVQVHVLSAIQETRLAESGSWLHEATLVVQAAEKADLRIKFPAAIDSLSTLISERLHKVSRSPGKEYVLSMDGNSQPRLIRLRWTYSENQERLAAPIVASLQTDPVPLPAHPRLLWVPPGMNLASSDFAMAPTFLPRLLHEAEEQVEITAALAVQSPRTVETAKIIDQRQRQFQNCLRHAEYALAILKTVRTDLDLSTWQERLTDVKARNLTLAKERQYEDARLGAQSQKPLVLADSSESGRPGPGHPRIVPPGLASVTLQFTAEGSFAARRTFSEMLVLAGIFLLVFSYFRHGRPIARAAAPEITIGVLIGANWIAGVSLIGAALTALLLVARVWWLVRAWRLSRLAALTTDVNQTGSASSPNAPS